MSGADFFNISTSGLRPQTSTGSAELHCTLPQLKSNATYLFLSPHCYKHGAILRKHGDIFLLHLPQEGQLPRCPGLLPQLPAWDSRAAYHCCLPASLRPGLPQHCRYIGVPILLGQAQGRLPRVVLCTRVRPRLQQHPCQLGGVPELRHNVQGRGPTHAGCRHVGASGGQPLQGVQVAAASWGATPAAATELSRPPGTALEER